MKKSEKFINSFRYAFEGLAYCLKTQRNIRIHAVAAVLVLILSAVVRVSVSELLVLLTVISLVIISEILNTAIETVVDMISSNYHPLAAIAKNVAAGAVLIASINAAVIGLIIFGKRILAFFM